MKNNTNEICQSVSGVRLPDRGWQPSWNTSDYRELSMQHCELQRQQRDSGAGEAEHRRTPDHFQTARNVHHIFPRATWEWKRLAEILLRLFKRTFTYAESNIYHYSYTTLLKRSHFRPLSLLFDSRIWIRGTFESLSIYTAHSAINFDTLKGCKWQPRSFTINNGPTFVWHTSKQFYKYFAHLAALKMIRGY